MVWTSQPQVARLESGMHMPSLDALARLAVELGAEFTISISVR
ncbi:MAG: helix-turn-helix transcriptional regulator [Miltoncostaeaceae bacterium]